MNYIFLVSEIIFFFSDVRQKFADEMRHMTTDATEC